MRNIREEIKHLRSQAEVDQHLKDHPITTIDIAEAISGPGSVPSVINGRLIAGSAPTAFVSNGQ